MAATNYHTSVAGRWQDARARSSFLHRFMDSLTQALYGATVQGALLGRRQGRRSLVYGAILGTLPDLDVIIRYADPVSSMTFHRGFSHSVFVLTVFSIVLAWLIRRWRPSPDYSGARLAFTIWAVLITHVLLDAFTAYGTQLFWPFSPTPTSWSNLFIVDPVFTVPLLAAVAASGLTRRQPMPTRGLWLALAFTTLYLAFTFFSQSVVEDRVRETYEVRGIPVERVQIGSAPFNSVLWRYVVDDGRGHYYEGFASLFDPVKPGMLREAVASGTIGATTPAPDPRFERGLALRDAFSRDVGDHALHDRLRWFTGDWLRYDEIEGVLVVTDLRMGLAGRHFFRFVIGERDADGHWRALTPRNWPGLRGGADELKLVLQRAWDSGVRLPLADWERDMR